MKRGGGVQNGERREIRKERKTYKYETNNSPLNFNGPSPLEMNIQEMIFICSQNKAGC